MATTSGGRPSRLLRRRVVGLGAAALSLACAALAAPAGSLAIAVPDQPRAAGPDAKYGAITLETLEKRARPRVQGPFFPVIGPRDFGEADARFGASRSGHTHEGQDVFAASGTPLVAVSDGTVLETGNDGGRGNFIAFYDPKRDQTYVYMHMVEPTPFAAGDELKAGEQVGAVGCTGSCYGDHLHFEIRAGEDPYGAPRDPLEDLESWKDLGKPSR